MRRLEADNIEGAQKRLRETSATPKACSRCAGKPCLAVCTRGAFAEAPVPIPELLIAAERA